MVDPVALVMYVAVVSVFAAKSRRQSCGAPGLFCEGEGDGHGGLPLCRRVRWDHDGRQRQALEVGWDASGPAHLPNVILRGLEVRHVPMMSNVDAFTSSDRWSFSAASPPQMSQL